MTLFIILALLNGIFIGLSRVINGRLSSKINPFWTSFWVFASGLIFLIIYLYINSINITSFSYKEIPTFAFFGGVFGSIYVIINNYIFNKLGATTTTLLVISGQMITALAIELQYSSTKSIIIKLFGVLLIIIGIYLSQLKNKKT